MTKWIEIMSAVLFNGLIIILTPALAHASLQADTAAPTDAQVRELQQQLKSLQQQLDEINTTRDATARRRLMQQNWQGMQNYMGRMHDRFGAGYGWMKGHPWMSVGPGMMQSGRASWPVPQGITPDQYTEQMRDQIRRMREQMDQITRTKDPKERERLIQEHWEGMYQNMQAMRGLAWMHDGGPMMGPGMMSGRSTLAAKPLPDADSAGAKLVSKYCVQCHTAPDPALHTAKQWTDVTQRMHIHMGNRWRDVKSPTEQEMKTIDAYMQKHAGQ